MTNKVPDTYEAAENLVRALHGEAEAWRRVPVPVRAAIAAAALVARDAPVTAASLARVAGYSRSTAARAGSPWSPLLDALVDDAGALLDVLSLPTEDEVSMGTAATTEIAKRDRRIAELRAELADVKAQLQPAMDYAHDLAVELRNFREYERAELAQKVVELRVVSDDEDTS